ncbi:MAG: hypothetical protein B7X34_00125 [Acidobacteriia bacterium 12-62-4]|nr:MAG: hypothetical protein B7X34_00125 [Acidobacteriia bacterium 12-62-4]
MQVEFQSGQTGAGGVRDSKLVETGRQGGPIKREIERLSAGRGGYGDGALHGPAELDLVGSRPGIPDGIEIESKAWDTGGDDNPVGLAAGDAAQGVGGHGFGAGSAGGVQIVLPPEEPGDQPTGGGSGGPPTGAGGGLPGGESDYFAGFSGFDRASIDGKGAEGLQVVGANRTAEIVQFECFGFLGRHFAKSVPFSSMRSLCLIMIHSCHFPLQ